MKSARLAEKTVVTVGSGHSPSNMCVTDEWLVNLDKLDKVQKFVEYPDLHYADVTVDAGMRLYQPVSYTHLKHATYQHKETQKSLFSCLVVMT